VSQRDTVARAEHPTIIVPVVLSRGMAMPHRPEGIAYGQPAGAAVARRGDLV
jgi:hypothetical protein